MKRLIVWMLVLCLALAGCSPQAFPNLSTPTTAGGGNYPPPAGANEKDAYPVQANPAPQNGARSIFPPSEIDSNLARGNLLVDAATLTPSTAEPGMYDLSVEGSLPTPCHQPRAQVNPPDASNKIVVDVYSVVGKDEICTQVIKPFAEKVAVLGGYPAGTYSVEVNGTAAGEINIP